jgi:hypothetical protein
MSEMVAPMVKVVMEVMPMEHLPFSWHLWAGPCQYPHQALQVVGLQVSNHFLAPGKSTQKLCS